MLATQIKVRGAVIVTRVSTGEQVKNGTSLESQLETCRAKAASLEIPIVAEYEDAGLSGSLLLTREGMQSAIADITAGRASMLICANISRYSRDVEHQQSIRKEVRAAGGSVVFCDMDFADTPEGDLQFSIMGGFAQYERKVIRERMMRGRRKRAEEGQQPARSRPPYGYHIVTHADITRATYEPEMVGRYVLREDTSRVARRIFESYALGGLSLSRICAELNSEGVHSPGSGIAWHVPTLRLLLNNPVYKGEPRSGRIRHRIDETRLAQRHRLTGDPIKSVEVRYLAPESEWLTLEAPALVSEELWQSVQDRIERMKDAHRGSNKQLRMLSGLTYCPECGCRTKIRYQSANDKRYEYLRCGAYDNARSRPERPCNGTVYPLRSVEDAVKQAISEAIAHPEAISAALNAYQETRKPGGDAREEMRSLDRALEQLRSNEAAAVQGQIAGIRAGASPDAYSAVFADIAVQRKDLENRRGELSRQIARAQGEQSEPSTASVAEISLVDTLDVLNSEVIAGAEKHDLVMHVVERVICRKGGAEIVFVPGLFGENEPGSGNGGKSIVHTTCIGIKTQR